MVKPEPVNCALCGVLSVVRNVRFEYEQDEVQPGQIEYILKKVVHSIVCPNCGEQTQGQVEDKKLN